MKEKFDKLMKTFGDVRFDSLIFIFGFGDGEYLDELLKHCCERNKIYIIEPNLENVDKYKSSIEYKNVLLISYNREELEVLFRGIIHSRNFVNIFVEKYDDYGEVYKNEYNEFIKLIDENYYRAATFMYTNKYFKKIYLENIFSNIEHINESTSLDLYKNFNKSIPAIIVSAGPSLDKNIEDIRKYKERLEKFFIIAGNRTLKPLLDNDIRPDLIVAIDPQDITYTMMEEYLNEEIPLVFYEQSNKTLIDNYRGNKIYTTQGVLNSIEGLEDLSPCYSGGSVAHCSTDIAVKLGCNPIIFIGQDFGYTFRKHHAEIASISIDKDIKNDDFIKVKDVFGNEMISNNILNLYKKNMEFYIKVYNNMYNIEFINSSYGADIQGSKFIELAEILGNSKFEFNKRALQPNCNKQMDIDKVKRDIVDYIEGTSQKAKYAIKICEELPERVGGEKSVEDFCSILKIIDDFIKDPKGLYFKGYLEEFLFDIKEKYFRMTAKEYPVLTNNLIYQSKVFSCYFKELINMLNEVELVIRVHSKN